MNIGQIMEQLDTFTDEERRAKVGPMIGMLSTVSKNELMSYQRDHFATADGDWEQVLSGLNAKLRKVIKLETSEVIGAPVREAMGLEPLTMDTEVPGT